MFAICCSLHDVFRNSDMNVQLEHYELACDGIIVDLAYCALK